MDVNIPGIWRGAATAAASLLCITYRHISYRRLPVGLLGHSNLVHTTFMLPRICSAPLVSSPLHTHLHILLIHLCYFRISCYFTYLV